MPEHVGARHADVRHTIPSDTAKQARRLGAQCATLRDPWLGPQITIDELPLHAFQNDGAARELFC